MMNIEDAPSADELLEKAEYLESGFWVEISALNSIAEGVALLLRAEAARR